jgi:hypothetical protein
MNGLSNHAGAGMSAAKSALVGLIAAGSAVVSAHAAPAISGSVEASYNRNLNSPDNGAMNALHAYDKQANTFTLNNAHLVLSGSDSATGLGYDVETDFGSDAMFNKAADLSQGASSSLVDLQEAYITWGFGPKHAFGLKAGKYATYEGIEVIEGAANPTVTRGLLFTWAEPITHTGLEVSYANGPVDVHVGAINGWDQLMDLNNLPSYLAKVGLNLGNPLMLTVSGIIGPEQAGNTDNMRMSFDATALTKVIPMVDLWLQANYGMEDKAGVNNDDATWLGFGVQPLVHVNKWFGLGLRYEFLDDDKLSRVGTTSPVAKAVTAAGKVDLAMQDISVAPTVWLTQNAMVRAEYRLDIASEKVFVDSDSKPTDMQNEVAADFVLSF